MKANLKKIFANDPETLRLLEQREQTALLNKIVEANMREVSVKGASMIKGDKGDKGDTPIKFVDYFTTDEIDAIANFVREGLKEEVRPIKGIDYNDGLDGKDGLPGKDGRNGRDGKDGRDGRDGKNSTDLDVMSLVAKLNKLNGVIDSKVIDGLDKVLQEFAKEFKRGGKHQIALNDVMGAPLDQRWHGGGLSTVAHDATLTGDGTSASPLSVVGGSGGVSFETPVGAVDDSNVTFTVSNTPSFIVVNGAIYVAGTGIFTSYLAGTITLSSPVGTGGFIRSAY